MNATSTLIHTIHGAACEFVSTLPDAQDPDSSATVEGNTGCLLEVAAEAVDVFVTATINDGAEPVRILTLDADQVQTLWSILQTEYEAAQDNLTDAELNSPERVTDERDYLEQVDALRKLVIPAECTHSLDVKDDLIED